MEAEKCPPASAENVSYCMKRDVMCVAYRENGLESATYFSPAYRARLRKMMTLIHLVGGLEVHKEG